jgi:hypothetical protein
MPKDSNNGIDLNFLRKEEELHIGTLHFCKG